MITVGTLHAGTVANVIPEEATFRGDDPHLRRADAGAAGGAHPAGGQGHRETFRATAEVEYEFGYPPLVNNAAMAALVRDVALEVVGPERVQDGEPGMARGGHVLLHQRLDRRYLPPRRAQRGDGQDYGHHHPRFDIEEDALATGVAMHAAVALRYLSDAS